MKYDFLIDNIINNNDNLSCLKIVKDILNVVLNDIEYMNEDYELFSEKRYFDLGNNNKIKDEDIESLSSMVDTITDIINDNEREDI